MHYIRLLVCAVLLTAAAPALAQEVAPDCPARPAGDAEAKKLASAWFKKADALFQEENYNWALGALLCSYSLFEHPATLFNAAQAARFAGFDEQALELARRCLQKAPYGETAEEARRLVDKIERELGVSSEPAETEETADVEGEQPASEQAGEFRQEPPPEPVPDDSPPDLATAGWITLSLGGAAAVAGGVLQGVTGSLHRDSRETHDPEVFVDKRDTGEATQKAAIAFFVVGGAAIATGAVLLAVDEDEKEKGSTVSLSPAPLGLIIKGRF
ncbi:MAG: hypothetical protein R6V85_11970 [Polyangia bacterium]